MEKKLILIMDGHQWIHRLQGLDSNATATDVDLVDTLTSFSFTPGQLSIKSFDGLQSDLQIH